METIEDRLSRLEARILTTEEQHAVLSSTVTRLERSVTEIRQEISVLATKFDVHAVSDKVDFVRTLQLVGSLTSGVTLMLVIIGLMAAVRGGL